MRMGEECSWVHVYGVLLLKMMRSLFPQVGTCVSEGGYPAGTLSWRLDGTVLTPDGKGKSQVLPSELPSF